jgi:serine/threonine protein kinase
LGKGSFATVHLGYDKDTKNMYAIKEMNKALLMKKRTGKGKNAFDCVLEELKVLQRLQHPNIIWLHEIIDDPKKDKIFLVTEW